MSIDDMIPINSYGFIYVTTNKLNGKQYIGQRKFDKNGNWRNYLGGGKYLNHSIKKHGKENFERKIICYTYSREDSNEKEKYYIEKYQAVVSDNFYNIADGGDVSYALSSINCKPVINIDTNYVFKSIQDASDWANIAPNKISETFNYKHSLKVKSEKLIFKPLNRLMMNCKLCVLCAKNIPIDYVDDVCEKCLNDINFKRDYLRNEAFNKKDSFGLNSEWVVNYLKNHSLNKNSFRYKELKGEIMKTESSKVIKNEYTPTDDLMTRANEIISLYTLEKMTIHNIESKIKISGVKRFLEYIGIKMRPNCFNNYSNQQIKPRYLKVEYEERLHVFKYIFEFNYWLEITLNKKYKNSQIKNYIERKMDICDLNYYEITEEEFHELNKFYKTVDEY